VFNRQASLDLLINKLSLAVVDSGEFKSQVEIIIVDDFSDVDVVISEVSLNIIIYRNSKNLGAPLSREKGFQLSQGRHIHFHDSDDLISDNWLKEIMSEIENKPNIDLLMTARDDKDKSGENYRIQKYFHKHVNNPKKIQSRLIYRNCMGPLGGVTFSRGILEKVDFKPFSSCQDWQMYIDAIRHAEMISSRPDIKFIFNKMGDDRISHNPKKKILGHLQLARITKKDSVFKNNIRLFYLYTCKKHIFSQGGAALGFYKKHRVKIIFNYLLISIYWRLR